MKRKRYLAFGYCMQNGELVTNPEEAAMVLTLYKEYAEGASLQKLVDRAQISGIKYRENSDRWNKGMIARVLDCTWYAGGNGAPALVSKELFERVKTLRKSKAKVYGGALDAEMRAVRDLLCCSRCGCPLIRVNHRNANYIRWRCDTCQTQTDYIPDQNLLDEIQSFIMCIAKKPELVQLKRRDNKISMQVLRDEKEIQRAMQNPEMEDKALLDMVCKLAEEKYRLCSMAREEVQTQHIQEFLQSIRPDGLMDAQVIRRIFTKIMVAQQGQISVCLCNGTVLHGGSDNE